MSLVTELRHIGVEDDTSPVELLELAIKQKNDGYESTGWVCVRLALEILGAEDAC